MMWQAMRTLQRLATMLGQDLHDDRCEPDYDALISEVERLQEVESRGQVATLADVRQVPYAPVGSGSWEPIDERRLTEGDLILCSDGDVLRVERVVEGCICRVSYVHDGSMRRATLPCKGWLLWVRSSPDPRMAADAPGSSQDSGLT
jgi:hypothetical protein